MTTQLISRDFHGATIRQRSSDGYLNATDMCQASGKRLNNYLRTKTTKSFLIELSDFIDKNPVTPIGVTEQNQQLIQTMQGGTPEEQGTWVHPYVSINLAQWCSPIFAVLVSSWVFELLKEGSVSLNPNESSIQDVIKFTQAKAKKLDNLSIIGNAKNIALNNAIKEEFKCDVLALFNLESPVAEVQKALLIPSEIDKYVGLKNARPVNKLLTELGLQTNHRDSKKNLYYRLTKEGLKHAQYQDLGIGKMKTPHRTIKWYESVIELLKPRSLFS